MRLHRARSAVILIHFRVGFRFFVGDAVASTDELSLGEDSFLPWRLSSLVGLLASALVVSVAILPPSFSHRSSIFFFRRFLAIGSGIGVSSLLFYSYRLRSSRQFLPTPFTYKFKLTHALLPQPVERSLSVNTCGGQVVIPYLSKFYQSKLNSAGCCRR